MDIVKQFYGSDKVIFREGESANHVFVVERGKVKLVIKKDGQELLLEELGPNAIFGEMALLDNKPRSASAIAVENTYCIKISKEEFEDRLSSLDPFMRGLFRVLVGRLRSTTAELSKATQAKNTPAA